MPQTALPVILYFRSKISGFMWMAVVCLPSVLGRALEIPFLPAILRAHITDKRLKSCNKPFNYVRLLSVQIRIWNRAALEGRQESCEAVQSKAGVKDKISPAQHLLISPQGLLPPKGVGSILSWYHIFQWQWRDTGYKLDLASSMIKRDRLTAKYLSLPFGGLGVLISQSSGQ